MKGYYCTCKSFRSTYSAKKRLKSGKIYQWKGKTFNHSKYHSTKVDEDGICLNCEHYAVYQPTEIKVERRITEKCLENANYRASRALEMGEYFSTKGELVL